MSQLCFYLPPFSSDYAGACSALYDLDGVVVIHDGHCCSANYAGFDEPRWFAQKKPVYCSSLREVDAVLGSDNKLMEKVRRLLKEDEKPAFIALLGSPAPAIIGADLAGIAAELETETGLDTFGITATGLGYYTKGIADTCITLLKRFTQNPPESRNNALARESKRINIVGLTPLDFSDGPNAQDILDFATEAGYIVNCCLSMGLKLSDLANAANADINLVVSVAGLPIARYMKQRWNIPYVVGTLFGQDHHVLNTALLNTLGSKETPLNTDAFSLPQNPGTSSAKILIVADAVLACTIRTQLELRFGCNNIDVGSFFGLDKNLTRNTDIELHCEKDLVALLDSKTYDILIGDPLFGRIPGARTMKMFEIPHVAVSSKLFWHNYLRFASSEAEAMLQEIATTARSK